MIGETYSHYRITAALGAGGMGEVYRAEDLKLDRIVALKFLAPQFVRDSDAKARFVHEAKAASALDHPNICTIHAIEETPDGRLFIAMACYEGETLKEMIARGPLPVGQAVQIALQVGRGLAKAHSLGIVHRDIKPANVFVTSDGLVKVLDFGIAKLAGQAQLTQTGAALGTVHYMSPEQVRGAEVDRRTDVWSLGVVLQEMLTGQPPFAAGYPEAVAYAIVNGEPAPLTEQRPEVPAELARTVGRCLQKSAAARLESADLLVQVLQPLASGREADLSDPRTARQHALADARGVRPYPGLASFGEADAEYFHGREAQVEAVWQKLRRSRLLAVAGPSGVGKTSFLRAGLLPARPRSWGVLVTTPGGSPFLSLREALVRELSGDTEAIVALLREDDADTDVATVRRWRRGYDEVLLIFDQFEELFTLSPPAEQTRLADLLSRLTLEADVRVLISLRDDFLHRCQEQPGLTPVFDSLTMLGPLTGPGLRQALLQPAQDCGYRVEDESLVDGMLAEVEGERGALPLLAFAMAELWEQRDREQGLLTRAAFARMGSVGGALAQHAEAVMDQIGGERQQLVRELFRNLVTGQGTRAVLEREQLLSVFGAGERPGAEEVLTRLLDARLLTSYEAKGEDGTTQHRVEIVHESLLSAWPRLVRWRTQDADGAQLRDQLRQAAQLWEQKGRSEDLLWTGTAFREFTLWRERYPGGLSSGEESFAQAMARRAAARRRRRRWAVGGAFAALLAVLVVVGGFWRTARDRARFAEAIRFESLASDLLLRQEDGDNSLALAFAIASLERGDTPHRRGLALEALWRGPTCFRLPQADEFRPSGYASFSPDGQWLATGSQGSAVLLWPADGGAPRTLPGPDGTVALGATYSPSGRWILTGHLTGQQGPDSRCEQVLWDAASLAKVRDWSLDDWAPWWFHPDETKILAYSRRQTNPYPGAAWWPISGDGVTPLGSPCPEPPNSVSWVPPYYQRTFLPSTDVGWLSSWQGQDVYVSRIDETSLGPRLRVGSHERPVMSVSIDAHGELISSSDEKETRIWSRRNPGRLLLRLPAPARSATFDRWTSHIFTGGADWRALLVAHDLRGPAGAQPLPFFHPDWAPEDVLAAPGHEWLAIGSWTAIAEREVLLSPLRGVWPFHVVLIAEPPARPLDLRARFAPDGRQAVISVVDRVFRFDLGSPHEAPHMVFQTPISALIWTVEIAGDNETLLVGTYDRGAWLVPLNGGEPQQLVNAPSFTRAAAFDPAGRRLAVGGGHHLAPAERYARVLDRDGRLLARLDAAGGEIITGLKFLSETELVVTSEGALRWWDIESGEVRLLREGEHSGIAVSDRSFLTCDAVAFWLYDRDALTARRLAGLRREGATALAIAPDESFVAIGYGDGQFQVQHFAEDRPHNITGPEGPIMSLRIDPRGYWIVALTAAGRLEYWPVPRGHPLQDRPLAEFLAVLKAQTNLRVVVVPDSPSGYRKIAGEFPGWETAPTWQEWYSEEYMKDPPWQPMLDLKALETAKR